VIDFRDPNGHADLWTASKNNKTFQEYYLTQFEYSFVHVDLKSDKKTGVIEIVYRSDPRRRHRLVFDGGHIEVKVAVSVKDIAIRGLRAGLAFESEISFHNLTILHPDSKLGVGILLFSSLSLPPTAAKIIFDCLGSGRHESHRSGEMSSSDWKEISVDEMSLQVSYVHLEKENMKSVFQSGGSTTPLETLVQPSLNRTPVLFLPNPLAHLKPGKEDSTPILVLAGPRMPLLKSTQRRRLHHSLAKAFYGAAYEQSYQKIRSGGWKHKPIGIRFQRFAFSAPGQQTADHAAWSMTLTMDVKEKADLMAATQSNESAQGIYHWGLFLINWLSSLHV
ncbi:hypothetical protein TSMEX_004889, partial [Taenia solium]